MICVFLLSSGRCRFFGFKLRNSQPEVFFKERVQLFNDALLLLVSAAVEA